ncbi:MFS general substrate transporter, partial [Ceratobasidium sp. AG-I]
MVEEIGVTDDPKAIGYYSGLVEGVFALSQFCTVCFWGSLSDRIGRRPVLLFGLCGVVGSTILFGLSGSFTMMLVSRTLSGVLNGNVAVIKSVLGEITDESNQGAAFVYLPLCWSLGSLIASYPILGGFLSHPSERYPSIFGSFILFQRYPYLLPCLAGAVFSSIGLIAGFLFLEEASLVANYYRRVSLLILDLSQSLAEKKPKSSLPSDPERRPLLSHQNRLQSPGSVKLEEPVPSMREILQAPAVRRVLVSYGFMALVAASVNAVFVLWLYTPAHSGGIGFSTAEIGAALALFGIL